MQFLVRLAALTMVLALSATAWAQPYYARGSFNGWSTDNPLTDMGGGHWQGTVTGLTPGDYYEYKLANADWSQNWPSSNGRFQADASGEATFHLWLTPAADGWAPTGVRVGYDDLGMAWEVIGSFNGWSTPLVGLTDYGSGLYSATTSVAAAGNYQFKFRQAGDWAVSIGSDFGNSAGNLAIGTTIPGQLVRFDLDLPNGRFAVTPLGTTITFDGVLHSGAEEEWASPKASALQDNYTGFGNQRLGDVLSNGSELDGLSVKAAGDRLYLGITGNLETNGNAILVFIDSKAGGQNVFAGVSDLGGSPAFPNMQNDTLDTGFAPDYVMAINTGGGAGHVDWYELQDGSGGTHTYRGRVDLNSGDGTLADGDNPGGLQLAFDNTNTSGVTSDSATDAGLATTGIEASIPLADLGLAGLPATVRVQVLLTSGGGFVSNQSLPTMPAGTPQLGNGTWYDGQDQSGQPDVTAVDFNTVTGLQYAEVVFTEKTWSGTLDGRSIPADFADSDYATLQENPTSFGNQITVQGVLPGSEINQIFAKNEDDALLLGITGNLHSDGTNLVIFLDTKPGGETTLTDHGGRLSGNAGDTLPCAVDYVILLNRANGNIYVDLYDLQNPLAPPVGLGYVPDSGLLGGPLTGGVPEGAAWLLGVNMGNLAGVSADSGDDVDPDGAGPLESQQVQNARTATTGFELSIPLAQIGLPSGAIPGTKIEVIAMLTGAGDDRDISNQILPAGLGGGISPFGAGPTDLTNVNGGSYECLEIPLGQPCSIPRFDADGDQDVDMDDFGAFQVCWTGLVGGTVSNPAYDPAACGCFDYGGSPAGPDGQIDAADFASFVNCASGANVPANGNCAGQ